MRRSRLSLVVLAAALCLAACSPKTEEATHFNAVDVTGADWGRDFHLTDMNGKPRQLADFKGQVVVLFFGFTQCPDVCPTSMSKLHEVMKQLGSEARAGFVRHA